MSVRVLNGDSDCEKRRKAYTRVSFVIFPADEPCASNPCRNGGTCKHTVDFTGKIAGYTCSCTDDFTGSQCQFITREYILLHLALIAQLASFAWLVLSMDV